MLQAQPGPSLATQSYVWLIQSFDLELAFFSSLQLHIYLMALWGPSLFQWMVQQSAGYACVYVRYTLPGIQKYSCDGELCDHYLIAAAFNHINRLQAAHTSTPSHGASSYLNEW